MPVLTSTATARDSSQGARPHPGCTSGHTGIEAAGQQTVPDGNRLPLCMPLLLRAWTAARRLLQDTAEEANAMRLHLVVWQWLRCLPRGTGRCCHRGVAVAGVPNHEALATAAISFHEPSHRRLPPRPAQQEAAAAKTQQAATSGRGSLLQLPPWRWRPKGMAMTDRTAGQRVCVRIRTEIALFTCRE